MTETLRRIFVENILLKVIALGIAVSLYVFVQQERTKTITEPVSVVYSGLPAGKVLVTEKVELVQVTMTGPFFSLLFDRLDTSNLPPYVIDLSAGKNEEVFFEKEHFDRVLDGTGFEIGEIFPRSVNLRFEGVIFSEVPVETTFVGSAPRGLEPQATIIPPRVSVRGAASVVSALESVATDPVDVTGRSDSFKSVVNLREPPELVAFVDEAPPVEVSVTFREVPVDKLFSGVPVVLRRVGMDSAVTPPAVSLTLRGPASVIDAMDGGGLEVTLDFADDEGLEAGVYERRLATATVRGLPEGRGVSVVSFSERTVNITLTEPVTPAPVPAGDAGTR